MKKYWSNFKLWLMWKLMPEHVSDMLEVASPFNHLPEHIQLHLLEQYPLKETYTQNHLNLQRDKYEWYVWIGRDRVELGGCFITHEMLEDSNIPVDSMLRMRRVKALDNLVKALRYRLSTQAVVE